METSVVLADGRWMKGQSRYWFPAKRYGWGWGWPYGEDGYSNTNVVVYPQVTPQFATGSVAATPCHWNAETFTVPASRGGTRPVQIVSCQ